MRRLFAIALAAGLPFLAASADTRAADFYRGAGLALHYCAGCHVIDARGTGPVFSGPPPFPKIARKPDLSVAHLRRWLSESHTRMPNMRLSDRDKDDLIAYIYTLRR